jgi:circadian clock protein KaiC
LGEAGDSLPQKLHENPTDNAGPKLKVRVSSGKNIVKPPPNIKIREKIQSGIPGFDKLLGGGLPQGNIVIVSGGCGVGKSTFCMQYLYDGAMKGEPGIYITFEQSADSIKESAYQFGMDLDALEKQRLLNVMEVEPTKILNLVKEGYGQLVEEVNRMGAKRVVVDALNAFEIMFREDFERRRVLFDFFRWLRQHDLTCLVISEIEQTLHENRDVDISEFIADGVVHMYSILQNNVREFAIEIIKMRQAKVLTKVCPFRFENNGIVVYPEEEVFSQV